MSERANEQKMLQRQTDGFTRLAHNDYDGNDYHDDNENEHEDGDENENENDTKDWETVMAGVLTGGGAGVRCRDGWHASLLTTGRGDGGIRRGVMSFFGGKEGVFVVTVTGVCLFLFFFFRVLSLYRPFFTFSHTHTYIIDRLVGFSSYCWLLLADKEEEEKEEGTRSAKACSDR
jgi:hypothetical protein